MERLRPSDSQSVNFQEPGEPIEATTATDFFRLRYWPPVRAPIAPRPRQDPFYNHQLSCKLSPNIGYQGSATAEI